MDLTSHKSSHSTDNGGARVELAGPPRAVLVRDSKDPDGPKFAFSRAAWRDFTASLRPPH